MHVTSDHGYALYVYNFEAGTLHCFVTTDHGKSTLESFCETFLLDTVLWMAGKHFPFGKHLLW